jgi:hypothetical protein
MLRALTNDEVALVSGGTNSEQQGYYDWFFDWWDFDSWLGGIDFDLRSLNDFSVTFDIYDGDGFDIEAYSNWGIDSGDVEFQGAGLRITIDF